MNRRSFLLGAAAAVAASPVALAQERRWVLIGTRTVSRTVESDIIPVGPGAGPFDHIQLRVRGNGLFVHDLDVVYMNGRHEDVPIRFHIPQGGASRAIELRGRGNRFINHVRFVYRRPADGGGPTVVELWGQR